VRSPYVARVLDAGDTEGGFPYLAMELVEGTSLRTMLERQGTLPVETIRVLIHDVARGLRDVHDAGVVHCDVKPSNIVLTGHGAAARFVLIDFGVAQIHGLVGAREVQVAGTPQYMSPEQMRGRPLDARSDLYSLCLIIYRALTGRPAFTGADWEEICAARRRGPAHPRRFANVSADLEHVLRVGLATRPERRFGTADDLAAAFMAAIEGRSEESGRWDAFSDVWSSGAA